MVDIAALLEKSSLAQAAAALDEFRAGWVANSHGPCNVEELRRIYGIRAARFRQLTGSYVEQLSISLDEFVANLATAEDAAMIDIRGKAEHHFLVIISSARNSVLDASSSRPTLTLNIIWILPMANKPSDGRFERSRGATSVSRGGSR
jgi:hypothetical protein